MTIKLIGFAAFCATVLAADVSQAFRADEPVSKSGAGASALSQTVAVPKMPGASQVKASRAIAARIEWDARTGAPSSIRGKDLGDGGAAGWKSAGTVNDPARNAVAVMEKLAAVYDMREPANELKLVRVDVDELGFRHVRLDQVYRGLRVIGAQIIVHFDDSGLAYEVNGRYVPGIEVGIEPGVGAPAAEQAAQNDLRKAGKPLGVRRGGCVLVVYADNVPPRLAWELALAYPGVGAGPGNWRYWVDARTGEVINRFNDIRKAAATISGQLLAGEGGAGTNVTGDFNGGYYRLINANELWRIFDYPNSRVARSSSATWGSSAGARGEMSAAVNFAMIQAYFSAVHGRNSFDDAGREAVANVHMTGGTDNAYWESSAQQFYFYPGNECGELTVLDVCAHEFTHAVTEYSANLVYQNEPGALNESFSDIFGAAVEFACQPDGRGAYPNRSAGRSDWLLGEDCCYTTADVALRDMRDPQRYNNPSKYHGAHWYYGSDNDYYVHFNSGVQNHFFYLLCEGGAGVNDGLSYSITGIGIENARRVAYRALTAYCAENTDYAAARTAWISAASDLDDSWTNAVQQAWAAVGVNSSAPIHSAAMAAQGLNNDFDGDGIAECALYNYDSGAWHIYSQVSSRWLANGEVFGSPVFLPVPGDFNGDGRADAALYSRSAASWMVFYAGTGETISFQWGDYYCIPAPGDYDGDSKTDFALYNILNGAWHIFKSSTLTWLANGEQFGGDGYIPVPGDYNGGGRSDAVVYSESDATWHIYYTENGESDSLVFGGPGFIPAPGDYDGDNCADFALYGYLCGCWYIWSPINGWIVNGFQWGDSYSAPVAGDYDGDGISDLAVYSRYNNYWSFHYMGTGMAERISDFGGAIYVPPSYWALYWYM